MATDSLFPPLPSPRPSQRFYGPDDFSYQIRVCAEQRPHLPHRYQLPDDTWVCFGMDSGGHRPHHIPLENPGWDLNILPDNRPKKNAEEPMSHGMWAALRRDLLALGQVKDPAIGNPGLHLLVRTLLEQFKDRERRIDTLLEQLRWAEMKLHPHRFEGNVERTCDALVSTSAGNLLCEYGYDSPVHARTAPSVPQPHRLGLPDNSEVVVDLPEVPEAFIRASLEALERFAAGYREYGPGAADSLGLAGQWGDLHRKVMKLKRALWSGEDGYLTRESIPEILQDIIGHALLALEMLERGFEGGR